MMSGLHRLAAIAGMYKAFRNRRFPTRDRPDLPRTEDPLDHSRGVNPA
jgi:hypothetical protein